MVQWYIIIFLSVGAGGINGVEYLYFYSFIHYINPTEKYLVSGDVDSFCFIIDRAAY